MRNRKAGSSLPVLVQIDESRDPYAVIPDINVQPVRSWKIRFVNTGVAISGANFTAANLSGLLGCIALSATTSTYFTNVFRLKRVQIWCYPTGGLPCTVQGFFPNFPVSGTPFITGPPKAITDTSLNPSRAAYISLTPPSNSSVFGKWIDSTSTAALLVLTYPPDAIVEFDFNWIMDDVGLPSAGPTLVGATAGAIYHKAAFGLIGQGVNAST